MPGSGAGFGVDRAQKACGRAGAVDRCGGRVEGVRLMWAVAGIVMANTDCRGESL